MPGGMVVEEEGDGEDVLHITEEVVTFSTAM